MISAVLAGLCVMLLARNLVQLLSFAAVISFLTSPILAFINLKVMNGPNVPARYKPGWFLNGLSIVGLIFFAVMTAGYIYTLLRG